MNDERDRTESHPDLVALLRGELTNAETLQVADHLDTCETCRADLAETAVGHALLEGRRRVLRCDRAHKMAVLHWLGQAGLADLQVQEPSLEDVYFGLKEAA